MIWFIFAHCSTRTKNHNVNGYWDAIVEFLALFNLTLNWGWRRPFLGDKIRRNSLPRTLKPTSLILLCLWLLWFGWIPEKTRVWNRNNRAKKSDNLENIFSDWDDRDRDCVCLPARIGSPFDYAVGKVLNFQGFVVLEVVLQWAGAKGRGSLNYHPKDKGGFGKGRPSSRHRRHCKL